MIILQPPIPAGPCFDALVLKFVSLGHSFPLRQMLDRWAAFKSDGQYLFIRPIMLL
jgi:hypothetical protein